MQVPREQSLPLGFRIVFWSWLPLTLHNMVHVLKKNWHWYNPIHSTIDVGFYQHWSSFLFQSRILPKGNMTQPKKLSPLINSTFYYWVYKKNSTFYYWVYTQAILHPSLSHRAIQGWSKGQEKIQKCLLYTLFDNKIEGFKI